MLSSFSHQFSIRVKPTYNYFSQTHIIGYPANHQTQRPCHPRRAISTIAPLAPLDRCMKCDFSVQHLRKENQYTRRGQIHAPVRSRIEITATFACRLISPRACWLENPVDARRKPAARLAPRNLYAGGNRGARGSAGGPPAQTAGRSIRGPKFPASSGQISAQNK